MLHLCTRTQVLQTCFKRTRVRVLACQFQQYAQRRCRSTSSSPEDGSTTNTKQPPQAVDYTTKHEVTPKSQDAPFMIGITFPKGDVKHHMVQRSFPNANPTKLKKGLERLLAHQPRSAPSNPTPQTLEALQPPNQQIKLNSTSEPQNSRWTLSPQGDAIFRSIHLTQTAYSSLQAKIEAEATVADHHPHMACITDEDGWIVLNILCTTHQPPGLSMRDVRLAETINELTRELREQGTMIFGIKMARHGRTSLSLLNENLREAGIQTVQAAKKSTIQPRRQPNKEPTPEPMTEEASGTSSNEFPISTPPTTTLSQPTPTRPNTNPESSTPTLPLRCIETRDLPLHPKPKPQFRLLKHSVKDGPTLIRKHNAQAIQPVNLDRPTIPKHQEGADLPIPTPTPLPANHKPQLNVHRIKPLGVRRIPVTHIRKHNALPPPPIRPVKLDWPTIRKYKKGEDSAAIHISRHLVGNKVSKTYVGEEPLTAGDILRQTRPKA